MFEQKKSKKVLIIIIVIIIILIIAGIVVAFNFNAVKDLFTKSEEITKDEFADWKIYRDEEYDFEIKYPSDVFYSGEGKEITQYVGVERRAGFQLADNSSISIYVWQKNIFSDYDYSFSDYKKTAIDNKQAFRGEREYESAYFIETYIYKDAYIYQIEYTGIESEEKNNLYTQIVSTFKFLK